MYNVSVNNIISFAVLLYSYDVPFPVEGLLGVLHAFSRTFTVLYLYFNNHFNDHFALHR